MRRRAVILASSVVLLLVLGAGPALACGGLVAPNGTINLLRTSTLAGYRNGVEHYVTSFEFAGGGGEFGSIVPLPGIPTSVVRGGDWTLQRLVQEVQPPQRLSFALADAAAAPAAAEVILETKIDALEITVLRGGGDEVGQWAKEHGFALTPDAPEVLDFYAERSPIFMAARFDADEAAERGQAIGDGTPIHLTIPTDRPWVPLRILALGRQGLEPVEADVFLLTDAGRPPALLPSPAPAVLEQLGGTGLFLARSEPASELLLSDLRSDKGMKWIPQSSGMWLTYLRLNTTAESLGYDLAIDPSGTGQPSPVDAGLSRPGEPFVPVAPTWWTVVAGLGLLIVVTGLAWAGRRTALGTARLP
jgi:Uncharacterized protein conserved in bacteria (DUF2330)